MFIYSDDRSSITPGCEVKKVINKAIPLAAANVLRHPIINAFIYFSLFVTFSYLRSADGMMGSMSLSGSVV